jgi:replicative DNA helicase
MSKIYNLEVEASIIGTLISHPKYFHDVASLISVDDFSDHIYKEIYNTIKEMAYANETIDILSLYNKFSHHKNKERINKTALDCMKASNKPSLNQYVFIVKEYSLRRGIAKYVKHLENELEGNSDVFDILSKAEYGLEQISNFRPANNFYTPEMISASVYDHIQSVIANPNRGITGVATGLHLLDNFTSGLQGGELYILAARPSMGKTALAITLAMNIAKNNRPVLFHSMEMNFQSLGKRILSGLSSVDLHEINRGTFEKEEFAYITQQVVKMNNLPIFIDDSSSVDIFELKSKTLNYIRKVKPKVIFVDYLQLARVAQKKSNSNREQEISTISQQLKALAKETNLPVVALSQLNRDVEKRADKKPNLADLRESGSIEQDADVVFLLHRAEYYGIMQDENGNSTENLAELIVAKNRNGPTGSIKLSFGKALAKFDNYVENDFIETSQQNPA